MFSKRHYKILDFITNFSRNAGAFLLTFDKTALRFSTTNDPRIVKRVRYVTILGSIWLFASIFIFSRDIILKTSVQRTLMSKFYGIIGLFMAAIYYILHASADDFLLVANRSLVLSRYLQRKYLLGHDPDNNLMGMMLDAAMFLISSTCFTVAFLIFLFCLYDPRDAVFLGQLIPLKYYYYFPMGVFIAMFHGYLAFILEANIAFLACCILNYMFLLTIYFTRELRIIPKLWLKSEVQRPANLRHCYRSFQVLNADAMFLFGPYVTAMHYVFSLVPAYSNVVLMRYWKEFNWIVRLGIILTEIAILTFWMIVLQIGKYLFVRGKKIFGSWAKCDWRGDRFERVLMRKFQQSCRLILIRHGNVFVLGRMTQFNYIKTVLKVTGKALIAKKGK